MSSHDATAERPAQGDDRRRWLAAVGSPALLAALLYANTLANGFVFDDAWLIERFESWDPDWLTRLTQRRAVAYGLQGLEHALFGDWPQGYRLVSILLHAAASSAAALLALRLSRSLTVGALCGLLFAAHPVHVEAVASLTNVADILAMLFLCLSLWLWAAPNATRSQRAGSLALLALALHSKPVAAAGGLVVLPLMHVLLLRDESAPIDRRRLAQYALTAGLLAGVVLLIASWTGLLGAMLGPASIQQHTEGAVSSYGGALATSAAAAREHFRLLFFPLRLSIDYPTQPYASAAEPAVALGLALVALWLGGAVALVRHHPLAAFAMAWVVVTFLPCSNLLPLTQFFTAERYLYVPSFGVCLLTAIVFDAAWRRAGRRELRVAVGAVIVLTLGLASARTIARNRDWRDTTTIAEASLRAGIESRRLHHMLGEERWREQDFEGAVRHLARASALQPGVPWLHFELAAAMVMAGDLEHAAQQRELGDSGDDLGPKAAQGRYSLATAYLSRDRVRESAAVLEQLTAAAPEHERGRSLLTWLFAVSADDGVRAPQAALALLGEPRTARALCLHAAALASAGELDRAADQARRARELARRSDDPMAARLAAGLLAQAQKGKSPRLTGPKILGLPR